MGAKLPAPRLSVYAATKYGLRGFAACLRQELHGSGVGVSVVFPGSVSDVGMFAESGAQTSAKTITSDKVAEGVIRAIEQDKAEVDVAPLVITARHDPRTHRARAIRTTRIEGGSRSADRPARRRPTAQALVGRCRTDERGELRVSKSRMRKRTEM